MKTNIKLILILTIITVIFAAGFLFFTSRPVLDLDANPIIPSNMNVPSTKDPSVLKWSVYEHIKAGEWKWNPEEVGLYYYNGQGSDAYVYGGVLLKDLEDKPILNANVLDYLISRPWVIPKTLDYLNKDGGRTSSGSGFEYLIFWGTIYLNNDTGELYVRSLHKDGLFWKSVLLPVDSQFNYRFPAILFIK